MSGQGKGGGITAPKSGDAVRLASIEGTVSIVVNIALFALKIAAGLAAGSMALIADAWHTLSDSLSSLIVILGASISRRKPDKRHPFGHGRIDLIAALIIGLFLAVLGFEFILEAVGRLRAREAASLGTFAWISIIVSIVVKEALAQYALWSWRKTGKVFLRAEGWHHRSDAVTSVVILVGFFVGGRFWWMDGAMSLGVALLLLWVAFDIMRGAINPLLGESPGEEEWKAVQRVVEQRAGAGCRPHHLHLHRYGDHTEITLHIELEGTLRLDAAHGISDDVEAALKEKLGFEATVHIEPMGRRSSPRKEP